MKRIFIALLIICLFSVPAFASDAHRKRSSGYKSSSEVIATDAATIYDIEVIATAAGGYACIFDSDDNNTTGKTKISEIREATQYNSKHVSFGEKGIKVHDGMYLYLNNATAIIHYY